jgi:23S rRNA pseudouridine1911/1915/1917 synthase
VAKKGHKLRPGDCVTFSGSELWLSPEPLPETELDVPIIYEDAALLALNKPAGLATHGFSGRDRATVANFLAARRPEVLRVGLSRWQPGLVHRLDRETSGLVLVAKTQSAFERLRAQFRRREIKKNYLALVWGITARAGSIEYPVAHDPADRKRMRAVTEPRGAALKSWAALTQFRRIAAGRGVSLLEIEMRTGVTHQIRVHLAARGHSIVGDALYGGETHDRLGLKRHFLHANRVEFRHPERATAVMLEAELPVDLRAVLEMLELKN